jgi:FkbM family methyltransferase
MKDKVKKLFPTGYKFFLRCKNFLRIFYKKKAFGTFYWNLKNGDEKLSINYDLNSESIFFDVGGYIGEFSEKINKKYNCICYIFEPSEEFFKIIHSNFKDNNKIIPFNVAISDFDGDSKLGGGGTGSSIVKNGEGENVKVISFKSFITNNNIKKIDYLKLNIEGSEYELLEHIINIGFIKNIKYIQVQFHNFIPNAGKRRRELRRKLKKTHKNIFNFPFVWERWDLK